jgi:hypothetical protein
MATKNSANFPDTVKVLPGKDVFPGILHASIFCQKLQLSGARERRCTTSEEDNFSRCGLAQVVVQILGKEERERR